MILKTQQITLRAKIINKIQKKTINKIKSILYRLAQLLICKNKKQIMNKNTKIKLYKLNKTT